MPIEHLFGQSADQRFAGELDLVTLLGLGENFRDMKWAGGGSEYVFNHCDIRPALSGFGLRPQLASAQGSQGAELTFGRCGKYIQEIIAGSGRCLRLLACHDLGYGIRVGTCQQQFRRYRLNKPFRQQQDPI
jgi:hypothetical protein